MRKNMIFGAVAAVAVAIVACQQAKQENGQALVIEKQGWFAVGGQVIQREGEFDPKAFNSWTEVDEAGQTLHCDHAMVHFQVPQGAKQVPMVFVHGFGGSGLCWEATGDPEQEGFSTLMQRRGYSTYVMDLLGRGRASRTSQTVEVKPQAAEQFWFGIWRGGIWPNFNEGVQFRKDEEYLKQFFSQGVPNLSDGSQDIPAINALLEKLPQGAILTTHSAGGIPGWMVAAGNDRVKAVVAYEPGGYVFPESEMPEPIPGLTGGCPMIPVPMEAFEALTKVPIVIYMGDFIPEEPSENLGDENWRVRLIGARKFVEAIEKHGGKATLVELPKIGIKGNTHMLFQDLNNAELADVLVKWLKEQKL